MKFHQKSFSTHFWFLRKSRKVDWMLKFLQNDSELLETQKNKLIKIYYWFEVIIFIDCVRRKGERILAQERVYRSRSTVTTMMNAIFYWLQFNFKCAG